MVWFGGNLVHVLMVQYCVLSALIYLMWSLPPAQQALEYVLGLCGGVSW